MPELLLTAGSEVTLIRHRSQLDAERPPRPVFAHVEAVSSKRHRSLCCPANNRIADYGCKRLPLIDERLCLTIYPGRVPWHALGVQTFPQRLPVFAIMAGLLALSSCSAPNSLEPGWSCAPAGRCQLSAADDD